MSLFDTLRDAIFRHAATPTSQSSPASSSSAPSGGSSAAPGVRSASPNQASPAAAPSSGGAMGPVDMEKTLDQLNASQPQRLNWRTSIVDLMKLVGMDSSLQHRQQMAKELGYTGSTSDTATMNVWLHQEVMAKLARSGVNVPSATQSASGMQQPTGAQQKPGTSPGQAQPRQ